MRLPNRISPQANSVLKSMGYEINSPSTIGIAMTIEDLLQRGYTTSEVGNILRPLTPALNEVVDALKGLE